MIGFFGGVQAVSLAAMVFMAGKMIRDLWLERPLDKSFKILLAIFVVAVAILGIGAWAF